MSGLVVPNDWVEGADGYCVICLTVPNSTYWRGSIKGQIFGLSTTLLWDKATGDRDKAAATGSKIYDSIKVMDCNLLSGLDAWFPLSDELDSIGSNDLANVGGVTFTPGKVEYAATFGGANYLHTPGLSITGDLSIACWIKPTSVAGSRHMICSKYNYGNANERAFRLAHQADGLIQFIVSPNGSLDVNNNQVFSNAAVPLNEWHHISVVFDATLQELLVYIDGQLDTIKSISYNSIYNSPAPFMVGATSQNNAPEQFFNGQIDELRVFSKALSEFEVELLVG